MFKNLASQICRHFITVNSLRIISVTNSRCRPTMSVVGRQKTHNDILGILSEIVGRQWKLSTDIQDCWPIVNVVCLQSSHSFIFSSMTILTALRHHLIHYKAFKGHSASSKLSCNISYASNQNQVLHIRTEITQNLPTIIVKQQ